MYDILQLNEMLVPELREIAEKLEIKSYKKLTKQNLIYEILERQAITGGIAAKSKPGSAEAEAEKPRKRRKRKVVPDDEKPVEKKKKPKEKEKEPEVVAAVVEEKVERKKYGSDKPEKTEKSEKFEKPEKYEKRDRKSDKDRKRDYRDRDKSEDGD